MERSTSPPTNRAACQAPPWETRHLAQVPYQESDPARSRPALNEAYGSASSDPTRNAETRRQRDHSRSASRRNDHLEWQRRPSQPDAVTHVPWDSSTPMLTAPYAFTSPPTFVDRASPSPPPSSSSAAKLAGPHTSTGLSSLVGYAPPSPPQSAHKIPSRTASVTSTPSTDVKAIPGTMSSRSSREQIRSKGRGLSRLRSVDDIHNKENSPGLGGKFKSAMKDLFHRSPIMESSFEKIQGRHWSEEDY